MIQKLFPYLLQLHIFQLEEYSITKFLGWISSHYFIRQVENKKPLIWTQKAKLLYFIALLLSLILMILLTISYGFLGFLIGLGVSTQSYAFLIAASFLLFPIEAYQKNAIKVATENKLASLKNLKVIGVTGSYGKTSVKVFLYDILKTQFSVLKTPESYNTPYGIAKVVRWELDDSYEYFICEMGAYRIGEIKEICDMVHPQYGILTGINEQHLETFGSLENTTKGKFELIDSLPEHSFGVVNIDNERIKNNLVNYDKKLISYGFTDKAFSIKHIKQTEHGTHFSLILDGKEYQAKTKLLGKPNLQNILAAATMSYSLGMKPAAIIAAIEKIQPVPHRLEIKQLERMTLIDNAFNSNVDGFKESIELVKSFKRPTIFVTPGIVDLGEKTFEIHKDLGKKLDGIDYVILIGKSDRTKGLKEGIDNTKNVLELATLKEVWGEINKLNLKNPVVLLENDLPDQY